MFQHTAARRRLENLIPSTALPLTFQHTAARRRLVFKSSIAFCSSCFNTQPPEGGWVLKLFGERFNLRVSTHSRPKAAGLRHFLLRCRLRVSTHSRPKAAGFSDGLCLALRRRFNTQPPEGGWDVDGVDRLHQLAFQHTAARRRLAIPPLIMLPMLLFQHTAARRRLEFCQGDGDEDGGFNTQPPEGGWAPRLLLQSIAIVSTHSRPKAAGFKGLLNLPFFVCFNTQPPEGGWFWRIRCLSNSSPFQHTAARRRLGRQCIGLQA